MTRDDRISTQEAVDTYGINRIASAPPGELILIVLDYVIGCCKRSDGRNARRGLVELMGWLNTDVVTVAGPLFRLYEYCGEAIQAGDFETPVRHLTELREAWCNAMENSEASSTDSSRGVLEA